MRIFVILAVSMISLSLVSCGEKIGTCETSLVNNQGHRLYICKQDVEDWLCEGTSSDYEQAFHKGSSCSSLGYGFQDSDGEWQFSSTSNSLPGSNGKWASTGGSSGGGGGTCSQGYKNIDDAQLNAYCGAAYAYRCLDGKALSSREVQAVCQIYNEMKEPGVPACNFCK